MTEQDDLFRALHVLANRGGDTPPPVGEILRRGRRTGRNRMLTTSAALGAVGLVGAVGLAVGVSGGGQAPTHDPSRPPQPAGRVDLVAAANATSATSYHFTFIALGFSPDGVSCNGGIDPNARVGWESDSLHESRVFGSQQYVKFPGHRWREQKSTFDSSFDCTVSTAPGTVDPTLVLKAMRDKGTVKYAGRHGSGAKAVDRYEFRKEETKDRSPQFTGYVGRIDIGVRSRYVEQLTNTMVIGGRALGTQAITYYAFGQPVTVSRPSIR